MSEHQEEDQGTDFFNAFESGNPEKEQKIREDYYSLFEKVQLASDSAGDGSVPLEQLKLLTLEANAIFDQVKRPNEARLDSELMKTIGNLARSTIEKAQSSFITFIPSEFAEKYAELMCKGGAKDVLENTSTWAEFGESTCSIYKYCSGLKSLPGALLDWTPAVRVPRARPQGSSDDIADVRSQPKEVDNSERTEETELQEVIVVRRALVTEFKKRNLKPINVYEFILDPNSFSKSVENLFHLSFLVRDGHAQITLDDYQIPVVAPRKSKGSLTQEPSSGQALLNLTVPLYEELVQVLKISVPLIPTEAPKGMKRPISA